MQIITTTASTAHAFPLAPTIITLTSQPKDAPNANTGVSCAMAQGMMPARSAKSQH